MFNLENEIAQWRQEMLRSGVKRRQVLDELEAHLREQFATLVRSDMTEQEAFRTAASRLGNADLLKREFEKLRRNPGTTRRVVLAAWCMLMVLVAWFVAEKIFPAHHDLLLSAHASTIITGYLAVFVSGGLAICQVLNKTLTPLPFRKDISFTGAITLFNGLAAIFVGVGLGLAMIWAKSNWGHFLTGDVKEFGAICCLTWLAAIAVLQRLKLIDDHGLLLAAIANNLVVVLAWFGAGFMRGPGHIWWFWAIVLNISCLLPGIVSRHGLKQSGWERS